MNSPKAQPLICLSFISIDQEVIIMKKTTIALLLGLMLTGASVGGATLHSYAETGSAGAVEYVDLTNVESQASSFTYSSVADVAEAVMPSVVAITNTSVQNVQSFFYGRTLQYESESAGSGIIVGINDTDLLICTNNHVVKDASELTVTFINNESCPAQLKGTDASNDLAVVSVSLEDIPEDTLNVIRIAQTGDSDSMRVGEQIVAIGNALGYGQSVTTGIISAKDRSIQVANNDSDSYGGYLYSFGSTSSTTTYEDLIQVDAAINFGNSGGALLNMNGEVIGINSAKASSSGVEGMGYAIPITKAMPILERLMNRATRTIVAEADMGYMGIQGQSVSSEATKLYGIPSGVYIGYVEKGSPADTAGIQQGDIIETFDSEPLTSMADLQELLQYYAAGEEVELGISRRGDHGYEDQTLKITLGERASNS